MTTVDHLSGVPTNATQRTNVGTPANMQARINHLENLVLDLMHHNSSSLQPTPRQQSHLTSQSAHSPTPIQSEFKCDVSPSPSDHGTIRIRRARLSYVGSSHWAAVLDSITELRNHFAQKEDAQHQAIDPVVPQTSFPKPQLFYSGIIYDSPTSLIRSIPSRSVVDRLVSRYFNVLDIAPGMLVTLTSQSRKIQLVHFSNAYNQVLSIAYSFSKK